MIDCGLLTETDFNRIPDKINLSHNISAFADYDEEFVIYKVTSKVYIVV